MLDRRREDLARLFKVSTGIEHVVDLGPVPGPLLDLVEVAVVSDERVVGFFGGPIVHGALRGIDRGPTGH